MAVIAAQSSPRMGPGERAGRPKRGRALGGEDADQARDRRNGSTDKQPAQPPNVTGFIGRGRTGLLGRFPVAQ